MEFHLSTVYLVSAAGCILICPTGRPETRLTLHAFQSAALPSTVDLCCNPLFITGRLPVDQRQFAVHLVVRTSAYDAERPRRERP